MYYTFIVNRSRHTKSDSLNIFFVNVLFFHLTEYRCCNIIQNRCSVILCICFDLPFFKNHTAHIKQTNFTSSSPYIYTKSIFFHAFTSLNLFQFPVLFFIYILPNLLYFRQLITLLSFNYIFVLMLLFFAIYKHHDKCNK